MGVMDPSQPATFTVTLPAGMAEDVQARLMHAVWASAQAAADAAKLDDPILTLGTNCPSSEFLQGVWVADGENYPWGNSWH